MEEAREADAAATEATIHLQSDLLPAAEWKEPDEASPGIKMSYQHDDQTFFENAHLNAGTQHSWFAADKVNYSKII